MRLFLANNERLCKNSYVSIKPCRTIKASMLGRWRNGKYKLRQDSLRELVEHIDFKSPWPKTIKTPSPVRAPRPVQHTLPAESTYQHPLWPAPTPTSYYILSYAITPPVRPARSDYHVPVQWTYPNSSHTYVRHERTPLIQSSHNYSSPSPPDNEKSVIGDFVQVVVVIAALVGAAWYFKML